jgi:predicted DNA-binding protein
MTTVRLPIDVEQRLEMLAKKRHTSKSDIIKEALENFFVEAESEKDSFSLGVEYFGKYGSSDGSLSISYKRKIKELINAKHHSH